MEVNKLLKLVKVFALQLELAHGEVDLKEISMRDFLDWVESLTKEDLEYIESEECIVE